MKLTMAGGGPHFDNMLKEMGPVTFPEKKLFVIAILLLFFLGNREETSSF